MKRIAIVGGGLTGLSLAHFLKRSGAGPAVHLFESAQYGGAIRSEKEGDCLLELGPETYFARNPLLHELSRDLGLEKDLIAADKSSDKRFILKEGRLLKVPTSALSFLFNSIIFITEKIKVIRAMRRPVTIWRGLSLFDATVNTVGLQVAEFLANPFSRGIFGAEAQDVEFAGAFPDLYEEMKKNSGKEQPLPLKVMLAEMKKEKQAFWKERLSAESFSAYKPGLYSFRGGLQQLTDALREKLRNRADMKFESTRISRISRSGNEIFLHSKNNRYGAFDTVIFTCSPTELAGMFRDFDKETSVHLGEMQYSPTTIISQSWKKKTFSSQGFGFLAPQKEKMPFLGVLFSSNIFPHKAPADVFLTKTMMAGDTLLFKDDEVAARSTDALKRLFRIKGDPEWSRITRVTPGLPRYFKGFHEWHEKLREKLSAHGDLRVAGWYYTGMGLPNCVESAFRLAEELGDKAGGN